MKKIRINLIILIFFISPQAYTCDCKELGPLDSVRITSYSQSDIVFLGELIEIDTLEFTYTFEILELFKGDTNFKIIKGKYFDSCSKFPRDKCRWIIYADFREEEYIDVSQCFASRSEIHPFCLGCYKIPPPLKSGNSKEEIDESKELQKSLLEKAKTDWEDEIEILRDMKDSDN